MPGVPALPPGRRALPYSRVLVLTVQSSTVQYLACAPGVRWGRWFGGGAGRGGAERGVAADAEREACCRAVHLGAVEPPLLNRVAQRLD